MFPVNETKNGRRSGPWSIVDDKTGERQEGAYVDGKRVGPWTTWNEWGERLVRATYARGLKDGPYTSWQGTELDRKYEEGCYRSGKRTGHWVLWGEHWPERSSGNYVNGKTAGTWESCDILGEISRGELTDGRKQGLWTSLDAREHIAQEAMYSDGNKVWEIIYDEGVALRRIEYEHGKISNITELARKASEPPQQLGWLSRILKAVFR